MITKIQAGDSLEFLTIDSCWETAICVEVGKESFSFLCLDGQLRILKYTEQGTKWK